MIPNIEACDYLAVKKICVLLRGIATTKGCFFCLNNFIFSEQKVKLNHIKKYVKVKIMNVVT